MVDKSIRARLNRLFSTNVIVRRIAKNKLKAVDTSQSQTGPMSGAQDRFRRLYTNGNYAYNIGIGGDAHLTKLELYKDYEAMDQDPIISSALDIYADESSVRNQIGDILTIKTDDENIKKVLHNLFFDVVNVDTTLWPLIRNLSKYGDAYWYLDIEQDLGIRNIIPLSPYFVKREEGWDPVNPHAYRFKDEGGNLVYGIAMNQPDSTYFQAYEVAHFRLLSDMNYLPYGKAMIENARRIFQQLSLMEDAMLLMRIMRAPERRVIKIGIGNLPPEDVDQYMEDIKSSMQKTPYIDPATGQYNLKFNLMNMMEDYFLPVRNGQDGTSIETLSGLSSETHIQDVEYLRKKEMAALKIPPAYLSYEGETEGKSTLAAEDIRFARTVERIQKPVESELTKIAIIHLYVQGFRNEDLINFEIKLNNPSIIYEKQRIDLMTMQLDVAKSMQESKLFSERFMYENIFNLTEDDWVKMREEIVDDQKMKFRYSQIENEGNDPKVTNQSFGTAHDIAAMQMAQAQMSKKPDVGEKDPGGRPKEPGTHEKHKDDFGYDPIGKKSLDQIGKGIENPDHKYKGDQPIGLEMKFLLNKLIEKDKTKSEIIKEVMNPEKVKKSDSILFLDEDFIADEI